MGYGGIFLIVQLKASWCHKRAPQHNGCGFLADSKAFLALLEGACGWWKWWRHGTWSPSCPQHLATLRCHYKFIWPEDFVLQYLYHRSLVEGLLEVMVGTPGRRVFPKNHAFPFSDLCIWRSACHCFAGGILKHGEEAQTELGPGHWYKT